MPTTTKWHLRCRRAHTDHQSLCQLAGKTFEKCPIGLPRWSHALTHSSVSEPPREQKKIVSTCISRLFTARKDPDLGLVFSSCGDAKACNYLVVTVDFLTLQRIIGLSRLQTINYRLSADSPGKQEKMVLNQPGGERTLSIQFKCMCCC